MFKYIMCGFMMVLAHIASAQNVTYAREDSIKVVALLKTGAKDIKTGNAENLMLYYGEKLKGLPYVAHTLEVNREEKLVVNLRQLDCTTFVETVMALALTTTQGSEKWDDYCQNLIKIRYDGGNLKGYPSRNHYFYWWMESNKAQGFVALPMDDALNKGASDRYARRQVIDVNYMSTNSSSYKMLKGNVRDTESIRKHERATKGKTIYYIPKAYVGQSASRLKYIKDGDILAMAASSRKKGLDTTHIGIAKWGKDGKLHLLNASQVHKKVVLEPMSLEVYMKKHPSQMGIWVLRPVLR